MNKFTLLIYLSHAVAALSMSLFVGIEAKAAPRVDRDIPYVFSVKNHGAWRYQSLDLVIPQVLQPPLAVFVHGGFWTESEGWWGIGQRLAQELVADGVAVALVRYRLSPAVRHPAHVQDVAAALAFLKRSASHYGYDANRLYLIGHSSGATLAAQLVLDPTYLKEHSLAASDIAGVFLLSGIYDLGPKGILTHQQLQSLSPVFVTDKAALRAASPDHARPAWTAMDDSLDRE